MNKTEYSLHTNNSAGGRSGGEALDNVAELEQMVTDHMDELKRLEGKVISAKAKFPKTLQQPDGYLSEAQSGVGSTQAGKWETQWCFRRGPKNFEFGRLFEEKMKIKDRQGKL